MRPSLLALGIAGTLSAGLFLSGNAAHAQGDCTLGADFSGQATLHLAAGDYQTATRDYSCALLANPTDRPLLVARMQAALLAGQFNQAVADANLLKSADRALFDTTLAGYSAAAPGDIQTLMLHALLLWVDAQDDQAMADYDAIFQLDPNNTFAYLFRGSSFQYMGETLQSSDDFADAVASGGLNADVYALIGSTYTQTGEYSMALRYLDQAIALDANHVRSYYFRGLVYLETTEFKQAEEDFTRAIELDPNFGDPYYDRGRTFAQQGDFTGAITDFSRAIDLNSQFRLAYLSRGISYAQMGQTAEATADLDRYTVLNQLSEQEGPPLLPDLPASVQMADGVVVRFPVAAAAGETLVMHASSMNNRVDPLMVLLDPLGQPVAANDDEVIGQFVSLITYPVPADGDYTLLLTHSDGGNRGPVDVVMNVQ